MIGSQRKAAGDFLFTRIAESLSPQMVENLDSLLYINDKRLSDFHLLKQPPARPSPSAMLKLIEKLKKIETTGILDVDLSWLSNNFQRSLTHYTKHCDANKMRELDQGRRYAALSCLIQLHTLITSSLWT
ncbi:MAG: hypothetical protein GY850_32380 [bacterium]|nr:hypothetical protein [bacterium]